MLKQQDEWHWFLSSAFNWVVGDKEHLPKTIQALASSDKSAVRNLKNVNFAIWKVPGATEAEYEIDRFQPQVDGAEYVGTVYHK